MLAARNLVPPPAMLSLLLPPRREFLVDQVAGLLRREIAADRWREWLPGERHLIKIFDVSRPTLRGALRQLVAARELVLYPRHGYRVGRTAPAKSGAQVAAATELGLICPERSGLEVCGSRVEGARRLP
jgi:DNA-binding FadR family transcriptional regulator